MEGAIPDGKVKLVSSDGQEYLVDTEIAFLSRTLETFFDRRYRFKEAETRTVVLPIKSKILKRIIEFMEHKHRSADNTAVGEFRICDEETMELLDVASYLRI